MLIRRFCGCLHPRLHCQTTGKTKSTFPQQFEEVPLMQVFDRQAKFLQRQRANQAPDVELYDYLKEEVAFRLVDRLFDVKRQFKTVADVGCNRGYVSKNLTQDNVEELILCDSNEDALNAVPAPEGIKVTRRVIDEEDICLENDSLDAILSNLTLHWVNNLPRAFERLLNALKPDGVLIANVFGGSTLFELRSALQLAELERRGGIAQHVSPFTEARDIGSLLTRAGFVMQTIDVDQIVVNYPTMFHLMWDLKGMGESNAALKRSLHLHRDVQFAAAAIYDGLYGKTMEDEGDRAVPATFQIIGMMAWKPHPDQKPAAPRGSAQVSLKDLEQFQEMIKWQKLPPDGGSDNKP